MSEQKHPIEGLMITAMDSIKDMVDVDTIIGEPIETSNNVVIIPISKVSFGFAAGGSEFKGETVDEYTKKDKEEAIQYRLPFGGGSGAGVTINPIAFLVIQPDNVKLMPINHSSSLDKFLDYMPELMEKANKMVNKCNQTKKEQTQKIVNEIKKRKSKSDNKTKTSKEDKSKDSQELSPDEDYEYEYDESLEDE